MSVQSIWVADHVALTTCVHSHIYYQLIYCKSGSGSVFIDGESYATARGSAYIVRPMQPHSITQIDGLHVAEVKFTVTSEVLEAELNQLMPEFSMDEYSPLGNAFSQIIEEGLNQTLYRSEATNCALTLFLIRLIRNNAKCLESKSRSLGTESGFEDGGLPEAENDADFLRVVDYIENHISEPITLDDLTALVHFDKSYLIVRFKEKWGVPPMKYVNWIRIERAKILLSVTDKSITEIAEAVGFRSVHYFSRFFKEKENIAPNDYRILRKKKRYTK